MASKILFAGCFALYLIAANSSTAAASMTYDGSWNLNFVTQRGACDRTYDFTVQVTNGVVSHPMLVRFTGRVASNGKVRASVAAGNKYAAGTGRLTGASGRGTWAGYSGSDRCSGYWVAARA